MRRPHQSRGCLPAALSETLSEALRDDLGPQRQQTEGAGVTDPVRGLAEAVEEQCGRAAARRLHLVVVTDLQIAVAVEAEVVRDGPHESRDPLLVSARTQITEP